MTTLTPGQMQYLIDILPHREELVKDFAESIVRRKNIFLTKEALDGYLELLPKTSKSWLIKNFPFKYGYKNKNLIFVKKDKYSNWQLRYFSHFEDENAVCYNNQDIEDIDVFTKWRFHHPTNELKLPDDID